MEDPFRLGSPQERRRGDLSQGARGEGRERQASPPARAWPILRAARRQPMGPHATMNGGDSVSPRRGDSMSPLYPTRELLMLPVEGRQTLFVYRGVALSPRINTGETRRLTGLVAPVVAPPYPGPA